VSVVARVPRCAGDQLAGFVVAAAPEIGDFKAGRQRAALLELDFEPRVEYELALGVQNRVAHLEELERRLPQVDRHHQR
jgi:hypothetical protein